MQNQKNSKQPQTVKGAAMRERLLAATVDCLYDRGYAGTSTNEVIKRAGVSRGALLHHYPSRLDLVLAAAAYASEQTIGAFREALAAIEDETERIAAALDLLWKSFTGPSFYALLELAVASRTDKRLNKHLRQVSERYDQLILETFQNLFPAIATGNERFKAERLSFFFMLQGAALHRIVQPKDDLALLAIKHFIGLNLNHLNLIPPSR